MAAMAQAQGIFYSPGRLFRFMGFSSGVSNGFARPHRRPAAKRPEPECSFEVREAARMQGTSAAEAAARFISSGRLW